mmetsp:Transcript_17867/g.45722  ORF Transcript_17867/g.45722 Transcript_17867/m.45722 type:complete len:208 (+) Transcript_17867:434-1057(+)
MWSQAARASSACALPSLSAPRRHARPRRASRPHTTSPTNARACPSSRPASATMSRTRARPAQRERLWIEPRRPARAGAGVMPEAWREFTCFSLSPSASATDFSRRSRECLTSCATRRDETWCQWSTWASTCSPRRTIASPARTGTGPRTRCAPTRSTRSGTTTSCPSRPTASALPRCPTARACSLCRSRRSPRSTATKASVASTAAN